MTNLSVDLPSPHEYLIHPEQLDMMRNASEYKSLLDQLKKDRAIRDHLDNYSGTIFSGKFVRTWDYALYPMKQQLTRPEAEHAFDEALFEDSFSNLMHYFYADQIHVRFVSLLSRFSSNLRKFVVARGFIVRKLWKVELDSLRDLPEFLFIPPPELSSVNYVVELAFTTRKVIGIPRSPPNEAELLSPFRKIENLVTAARILKTGHLALAGIILVPSIESPALVPIGWKWNGAATQLRGIPYFAHEDELREIRRLWNLVDRSRPGIEDSLSVALRRFNFAYQREFLQDRLLDFMIAFEALFLAEDAQEVSHRLSLRVARMLGNTFSSRSEIQKQMKQFYAKRSKVVHGVDVQLDEEFVAKVEEYLRMVFRKLIPKFDARSHKEILKHLDLD